MKKYLAVELELLEIGMDVIRTSGDGEGDTPSVDIGGGDNGGDNGGGQTPWDPVSTDLGNDAGISGGAN